MTPFVSCHLSSIDIYCFSIVQQELQQEQQLEEEEEEQEQEQEPVPLLVVVHIA